jgi:hypothetical protein
VKLSKGGLPCFLNGLFGQIVPVVVTLDDAEDEYGHDWGQVERLEFAKRVGKQRHDKYQGGFQFRQSIESFESSVEKA